MDTMDIWSALQPEGMLIKCGIHILVAVSTEDLTTALVVHCHTGLAGISNFNQCQSESLVI